MSWIAGPALEIVLLACMVQRKLHTAFPRFFSYIIFQVLKSAILFLTYRYYEQGYFDAYWTGNAISVILAVTVMDEILQHVFKDYGGAQNLGSVIFRWACGLLLLLAIVTAVTSQQGSADRVVAVVLAFDRSVRVMQCGLFCLLMILCRLLKNCWRQQVFGIALGFGVFASIELILVSVAMRYGGSVAHSIGLATSVAYNAVTILWIGYLSQPAHSIPAVEVAPRLDVALASPAGGTEAFLTMVERAVEDVISRNPWPRPSTKGPNIVGREPGPGESN
ncbi:MAG TPA: hypothetical protein VLL05_17290 [Terriglobales bacterium]|nr:hypothetical protein [Terriglobales bacterium]